MTTSTIAMLANLDGVATGLDVQSILRDLVMPEFFMDVGEARWRNKVTTLSISAADRQVDLPDDFWSIKSIVIPPSGVSNVARKEYGLKYLGEDVEAIIAAEMNSTAARPTGYWIAPRSGDSSMRAIRFNCPADADYTAYYVYERGPVFDDSQSDVDMDTWVPGILQPGIVKCLRMHILEDRFGQNDPRFEIAKTQYAEWVERTLARGTDQARRNFAKYAS